MGRLVSVVLHGRVVLSCHGTNGRGTLVSPLSYCFLAMVHDAHVGDRPVGYGSFGGLLLRHSVGLLPACQLARVVVVDAPSAFVVFLFSVLTFAVGSSCLCLPTALLAFVLGYVFAQ